MVKRSTTGHLHTAEGMYWLGERLKWHMRSRYRSLVESMFVWEDAGGRCDQAFRMSLYRTPEKFLIGNSKVCIFDYYGNTHMLPVAQTNMLNIYGEMTSWHVVPVAWADDAFYQDLMRREFSLDDSALMTNSYYGTNDLAMIWDLTDLMVDCMLTLDQRTLMARAPFIFTVEGNPQNDVQTYMSAIMEFQPWITKKTNGSLVEATISDVNVALDPSLMDLISFWESILLAYIGISSTDIHKRAQQSVPETTMAQDKIIGRRKEKLRCRQKAADHFNDLYSSNIQVISVFDEVLDGPMDGISDNGGQIALPYGLQSEPGRAIS